LSNQKGRKTIAVDFDGVIHRYSKGWSDGTCYDIAVPGAFEAIRSLMETHNVFILSTRNPHDIKDWFENQFRFDYHGNGYPSPFELEVIPNDREDPFWQKEGVLGITNRKFVCIAIIDDRAIRFTNWNDIRKYWQ